MRRMSTTIPAPFAELGRLPAAPPRREECLFHWRAPLGLSIVKISLAGENSAAMALPDFVIVILAAGKSTRLRSNLTKVLHRVGGHPLVEHVARACRPLGARALLVVVGHQSDEVAAAVAPLGARAVLQQPQRGTGHALVVARKAIGGRAKYALVVPGDAPLMRTETLRSLARAHQTGQAAATILSAQLADPTGYGRILRSQDGRVAAIVEQSALTEDQRGISEINSSIYCFTLAKLWPCLAQLRPANVHRELYLTDVIALLSQQGETVLAQVAADPQEVLGCNTRAELSDVDRTFRQRKRDAVIVEPHCVVVSSRLGNGAMIGPFARLRPQAELRAGARVGNFVEVKKTVLAEGAKAMHLSYLGDARIGAHTNIGAGTITCNYDGTRKHPTTIGKRVFIGSDTALVAPVRVGDGAYVAAGSTITDNVPPGALGIARGRQVNKPGWVAARRREAATAHGARPASKRV